MHRAARSVLVWGVYLIVAGLGFLFIPNVLLPLFGSPTTTEVWVRVVGLLVAIIGGYYVYCARNNVLPFIKITVPGRLTFALGALGLVLWGLAPPSLLLIGGLDVIGAIWTWSSLRSLADAKADEAIAHA
jgi:hypothetical protein